jgi:hypothetical protein
MDEAVSWLRGNNDLKLDKHAEISALPPFQVSRCRRAFRKKKRQPMLRMNWLRNNDPNSDDVDAETAHAFANLTKMPGNAAMNLSPGKNSGLEGCHPHRSSLFIDNILRTICPSPCPSGRHPVKRRRLPTELANP